MDGAQAEYVLVPLADTTLYTAPKDVPPEAVILMADVGTYRSERSFSLAFLRSSRLDTLSHKMATIYSSQMSGKMSQQSLLAVDPLVYVQSRLPKRSSR